MVRLLIALLVLALAAPVAAAPKRAPKPVAVSVETLADGMELVHAEVPDGASASLRYVVRSGARDDPSDKEGLAHVVEHLLFADVDSRHWTRLRTLGCSFNGRTSQRATVYELDCPKDGFVEAAELFLSTLTNPGFDRDVHERELKVIESEDSLRLTEEGMAEYLERAVFPLEGLERNSIIGTHSSRRSSLEEAAEFYQAHYRPTNTAVVFSGALGLAEARGVVERAILLPPEVESAAASGEARDNPSLPYVHKVRAPVTLFALGYHVGEAAPDTRSHCDSLAALVELKLESGSTVEDEVTVPVSVNCVLLQGERFLVAVGFSRGLDASVLPSQVERAFKAVVSDVVTAQERTLVERRLRNRHAQLVRDAHAVAEKLAQEASKRRLEGAEPGLLLAAPKVPKTAEVSDYAKQWVTPKRHVQLLFSPFQG